jgi:hypothetical protein
MTYQDEECAMEKLKNVSPVATLIEMAEEMGKRKDFIINGNEALGKKCSKMPQSKQESDVEASVPSAGRGSIIGKKEERGSHNAECKEADTRPLQSGK